MYTTRKGDNKMNFREHEHEVNIEILIKNSFSSDLPNNLCLANIDTGKVIDLFEDIANRKYDSIFGIDDNTGLITTVRRKKDTTPAYIFNDGVEPVQYFDYKNNKRFRELSIPNFNYYIAFVYNTILMRDSLFAKLYDKEVTSEEEYSNSPILVKNIRKEIIFTKNIYNDFEPADIISNEEFEFIGENERGLLFNTNVLKDIIAEGSSLYYLETDIESYFQNIYTHSFNELKVLKPFNYLNDEKVQKYFDFLDYYNMKINFNHTKGILTGPLSSSISAELLLMAIDELIREKIENKEIAYKRYVDDMWFYSNDVTDLDNISNFLQEILRKFNLDIQHEKTHIEKKIRSRKTGNINEVYNTFPFLKEKKYKLGATDILFIISQTSQLNDGSKYPFWKTFFTIFYNKIDKKEIIISDDLVEVIITTFLKLGYLNSPLQVRIYRVIDALINQFNGTLGLSTRKLIFTCLKKSNDYVNNNLSNTVGQIWHYYLICKVCGKDDRLVELNELIRYYSNHNNFHNKEINPLVLVSFVEYKNLSINDVIFTYVTDLYYSKVRINEQSKIEDVYQTIAYSKWWIVLLQLKVIGAYENKNFDLLFQTKVRKKPVRDKLYLPFSIIEEKVVQDDDIDDFFENYFK